MKKRISLLAFFLTIAMILNSGVLIFGTAADPIVAATGFASGTGTEADPYVISTPAQWAYFAAQVTAGTTYSGQFIQLNANLTFNTGNAADWATTPPANEVPSVGTDGKPFKGTFDGQGHTVSGVYIDGGDTDGTGLFGECNGATIRNLLVGNSAVKCQDWCGILVGEASGSVTIENVYLAADTYLTVTRASGGNGCAGGFLGGCYGSSSTVTIRDSVFAGTVELTGNTTNGSMGGFVGSGNSSSGKVHKIVLENCLMIGTLNASASFVSGFVGANGSTGTNWASDLVTFTGCVYAAGTDGYNVSDSSSYPFTNVGKSGVIVTNCYSTESGYAYKASNAGSSAGVTNTTIGALMGTNASVTISGWTKRANDIMIPTGVASLYIVPGWLANYNSQTNFYISTTEQWVQLSKFIAGDYATSGDFAGKNVVLAANLTFNTGNAATWGSSAPATEVPTIGSDGHPFKGTFEGQSDDGNTNYVISGVYMNSTADGTGLFGEIGAGAIIRNVTLVNSYIKCKQWAGALVGEVSGAAIVRNCYLGKDVYVVSSTTNTNALVGGLIGGCYGTWAAGDTLQIKHCVFAGSVTANKKYVGGILGTPNSDTNNPHTVEIENCLNTGSVKGRNVVAGIATGSHALSINKCVNTGSVKATMTGIGTQCADIWTGKCCKDGEGNEAVNCVVSVTNCKYTGTTGVYNLRGERGATGTFTDTGNTRVALADLIGTGATAPSGWTKTAGELAYPQGIWKNKPLVSAPLFTFGLENGASVRLQSPTGLRFKAVISQTWLASLANVAGYGIVIAPTSYVETAGVFTMAALDAISVNGAKYLKIPATNLLEENSDYAILTGVISNIRKENYSVAFSAIAYVEFGNGQILYSAYDPAVNSRSVAHIARLAHEDVTEAPAGKYTNEVTVPGATAKLYSPYTSFCRSKLEGFYRNEKEIRVLQQNLLRDPSNDKGLGNNVERSYRFLKEVVKYDPDVILLQEVDCEGDWYKYALKYLTDYTMVGLDSFLPGSTSSHPAIYNCAVLYRTDRFGQMAGGVLWLTNSPETPSIMTVPVTIDGITGEYEQMSHRTAVWTKLTDGNNGNAEMLVCSVHLSTNNAHLAGTNTQVSHPAIGLAMRNEEIRILREQLESKAGGAPIIMGGDFNCGSITTDELNYLIDNGYADVYHNAPENVNGNRYTSSADKPAGEWSHLDWCFYTADSVEPISNHNLVEKFQNKSGSESGYVSDHWGVISDLIVTNFTSGNITDDNATNDIFIFS